MTYTRFLEQTLAQNLPDIKAWQIARNLFRVATFVVCVSTSVIASADIVDLYGVGNFQDLIEIDSETGQTSSVGYHSWGPLTAMTYDSNRQSLYATSSYSFSAALISIDPSTGEGSLIKHVNRTQQERFRGMAFDPGNDVLYAASNLAELVTFDTTTGDLTSIGNTGTTGITGMAFDGASGLLYAVDFNSMELLTLDTLTGESTSIGSTGFDVSAISFHPVTNQLFGVGRIGSGAESLIVINKTTGAGSEITGIEGYTNIDGLAFGTTGIPEPSSLALLSIVLGWTWIGTRRRSS